ncbi:MAG: hypothetical protein V3T86_06180 [Planctomycetota bacterium]
MVLRSLLVLLLAVATVVGGDGKTTAKKPTKKPPVKKPLNEVYKGRIVKIKGRKITIYYDFEEQDQLEDFEDSRPPRLLDATQSRYKIFGGRLLLEGSSGIRHKMEGEKEIRAKFNVRVSQKSNVGTVFTEPVMSDFFVVLNLFDDRFYGNGMMILASCGLHEDEGADLDMAVVNWRDIYVSNLKNKVKRGQEFEMEVAKDGWTEYVRVMDVEGKGSSKGKGRHMPAYNFGFWVHHSRASFDDLYLTIELSEEFLELNNLKAEVIEKNAEPITSGPLAGLEGVPPKLQKAVVAFAKGRGPVDPLVDSLGKVTLHEDIREALATVMSERRDPKSVPILVDSLYSTEKSTRALAIRVVKSIVGKDFGYRPGSSEKKRSKCIQKLNDFMTQDRARFYGP